MKLGPTPMEYAKKREKKADSLIEITRFHKENQVIGLPITVVLSSSW